MTALIERLRSAPARFDVALEAADEIERLTKAHAHQYEMTGLILREAERNSREAALLRNALWKACGDDEQIVAGYLKSVGWAETP